MSYCNQFTFSNSADFQKKRTVFSRIFYFYVLFLLWTYGGRCSQQLDQQHLVEKDRRMIRMSRSMIHSVNPSWNVDVAVAKTKNSGLTSRLDGHQVCRPWCQPWCARHQVSWYIVNGVANGGNTIMIVPPGTVRICRMCRPLIKRRMIGSLCFSLNFLEFIYHIMMQWFWSYSTIHMCWLRSSSLSVSHSVSFFFSCLLSLGLCQHTLLHVTCVTVHIGVCFSFSSVVTCWTYVGMCIGSRYAKHWK